MKAYNGYRSWNGWNVSLWINNSEELYRYTRTLVERYGRERATEYLTCYFSGCKTPDGAVYNRISIYNALEDII